MNRREFIALSSARHDIGKKGPAKRVGPFCIRVALMPVLTLNIRL